MILEMRTVAANTYNMLSYSRSIPNWASDSSERMVRKTIQRCRDKTAMLPILGGRLLSEASEFVEDEALDGI
ncbi:hypothetical protein CDAR_499091 [Caerostris darwini]|uniref:Uncharacterized protein n=1 Tax=Caerostris darwini TaxID=1538125 RepID=A0AAV4TSX9_9ARAC|nr:hypothetical protein CDAR_499091 [Caerostris darwini]